MDLTAVFVLTLGCKPALVEKIEQLDSDMKTNISFCDIVEHELVSIELPRVGVNALNNVKQLCGLPQGGQFADEVSQQFKDKKESLREKECSMWLKKCDAALQVEHQPFSRLYEEFQEIVD